MTEDLVAITCLSCKNIFSSEDRERKLCRECWKTERIHRCIICNQNYCINKNNRNGKICGDCKEKLLTRKCANCGSVKIFKSVSLLYLRIKFPDRLKYCNKCIVKMNVDKARLMPPKMTVRNCRRCSKAFETKRMYGTFYCPPCKENILHFCKQCNKRIARPRFLARMCRSCASKNQIEKYKNNPKVRICLGCGAKKFLKLYAARKLCDNCFWKRYPHHKLISKKYRTELDLLIKNRIVIHNKLLPEIKKIAKKLSLLGDNKKEEAPPQ